MKRIFVALSLVVTLVTAAAAHFNLPPLAPRDEYGNILLSRTSTQHGVLPVTFSHWLHRKYYTCRVCHTELDFNMKVNTTEITERDNRNGKFCGACHNGKIAFRHNGNCDKCHNGEIGYSNKRSDEFMLKTSIPMTMAGNGVNWSAGISSGAIKPQTYLKKKRS